MVGIKAKNSFSSFEQLYMQKWKLSRKTKHKHFMPTECSFYPNTAGQHPGGRRNRWIVWLWNWTTEHQDLIQVLGIYPSWVKNSPGNSEIFPIWMWNENVEINVCSSTGGWGGWLGGWPPQTAWVLTGQNNVNVKNDAGKVEVVPVLKHRECFPSKNILWKRK